MNNRRLFQVWVRQGGPDGTASYFDIRAENAEMARWIAKRTLPNDCVVEEVLEVNETGEM